MRLSHFIHIYPPISHLRWFTNLEVTLCQNSSASAHARRIATSVGLPVLGLHKIRKVYGNIFDYRYKDAYTCVYVYVLYRFLIHIYSVHNIQACAVYAYSTYNTYIQYLRNVPCHHIRTYMCVCDNLWYPPSVQPSTHLPYPFLIRGSISVLLVWCKGIIHEVQT